MSLALPHDQLVDLRNRVETNAFPAPIEPWRYSEIRLPVVDSFRCVAASGELSPKFVLPIRRRIPTIYARWARDQLVGATISSPATSDELRQTDCPN